MNTISSFISLKFRKLNHVVFFLKFTLHSYYLTMVLSVQMSSKKAQRHCMMFWNLICQRCGSPSQQMPLLHHVTVVAETYMAKNFMNYKSSLWQVNFASSSLLWIFLRMSSQKLNLFFSNFIIEFSKYNWDPNTLFICFLASANSKEPKVACLENLSSSLHPTIRA